MAAANNVPVVDVNRYFGNVGIEHVPVRRVNVNCGLVIVGQLAVDQLDRLVGLAKVVIAALVEIAIVVGGEDPFAVATDFRVQHAERRNWPSNYAVLDVLH